MTALLTITLSASAMSYEQARQQALFLTDKMAYELNLTEEQYEAAYEVNLDYLMSVNTQADLYGVYWTQRNLDLSYILLDWQYEAYLAATYFYRPLYWERGYWHFGIYARYPYRDYFYFGRPHFWTVYRGGHSWRMNGGRSWYHGRNFGHRPGHNSHGGMRDRFDRGDYGRGHGGPGGRGGNNPGFGNHGGNRGGNNPSLDNRGGSRGNHQDGHRGNHPDVTNNGVHSGDNGAFNRNGNRSDRQLNDNSPRTIGGNRIGGGSRSFGSSSSTPSRSLESSGSTPSRRSFGTPSGSESRSFSRPSTNGSSRSFGSSSSSPSRSFGSSSRGSSTPSRSFGSSSSSPSRSFGSPSRGSSAPSRSFSPSSAGRSSSSFGGSHSGGGSRGGFSGGGGSRGGGSFGGGGHGGRR